MAVLDRQEKMMMDASLRYWLISHQIELKRWLHNNVNYLDHEGLYKLFWEYPHLGKVIVESDAESQEDKWKYIIEFFMKSRIAVMTGVRGSGKTALGLELGEELHKNPYLKKIYIIQTNMGLPDYFIQTLDPYTVDENSFLIYDEASISLQSRRAMASANIDMSALMAISRHRDFSLLFISQHSYLIDTNIFRMADALFFKKPSFDELEKTSEKGNRITDVFNKYVKLMAPKTFREVLFTDGERWLKVENELPSFWSDEISRTYRKLAWPSKEGVEFIVNSFKEVRDLKRIQRELLIRGVRLELDELQNIVDRPTKTLRDFKEAYKQFGGDENE